ncbi:MAG: hypothetical protein ABFC38_04795 [Methanospirillum sp.]
MRILKVSGFKRCIDGTILKECLLDDPVPREMVEYFAHFGSTRVMENMKQPFFSFVKEGFFSIKGLIGDTCLYVRFIKERMEISTPFLSEMVNGYDSQQPDIKAVRDLEQKMLARLAE